MTIDRHSSAEIHTELLRLYHVLINAVGLLENSRHNLDDQFLVIHRALRELRCCAEAARLAGVDPDAPQPATRATRRMVRRAVLGDDELPFRAGGEDADF